MAIEILRPDADGDIVDWVANGAANDWDCVDEGTPDDDTTYLNASASALDRDELINLGVSGIVGGTIQSVELSVRVKGSGTAPDIKFLWKENGVTTVGAVNTTTAAYVDYVESRSVRPSDGVAWTVTDLNVLQVGLRRFGDITKGACRCTQVFITVDYSLQAGRKSLLGVGR